MALNDTAFQSTLLMRGATYRNMYFSTFPLQFQSTLLMRGATQHLWQHRRRPDFNPRSSCEERLYSVDVLSRLMNFNPRSSCEERLLLRSNQTCISYFNPRSSCEERRGGAGYVSLPWQDFNPRSSCEERLGDSAAHHALPQNFNPRSSCEERPSWASTTTSTGQFQSTLLMRGATRLYRSAYSTLF